MRFLEGLFPSLVRVTSIGTSYEGREIPALKVSVKKASPGSPRKTLVVTGGLHAREWISTTTVNYVAWSYITQYGKDRMVTKFLDEFDLVFIPVVNPDGVQYTWQVDRLWRKSRQETKLRFCRGMDLDRAFGYEWDGRGSGSDPCSETYGGSEPFQAVEAQQVADWAKAESENGVVFEGLVDLHSYSQQILFPYSYSCSVDPPNLENLEELGVGLAKAIRLSSGEIYSVTSACEGITTHHSSGLRPAKRQPRVESSGGSAMDWFYHELHARYSYQIKLRDTGGYGFLLPAEYIIPTGREIFSAFKYLGDYLLGNNGIEGTANSDMDTRPVPIPGTDELR
jgi:extracellular matrix protein 14